MQKLKNEIKYWSQIFLIPIYGLSYLMPRSKKIWVFGSTFGRRFADNPKYFYLYLKQHKADNIRAIWISKNKDVINILKEKSLEGYYLYSLKGFWYSLRAGVYLYDNYSKDICFTLSGGAMKINLWHGIPLKKIQKDNKFDFARNPRTKSEKRKWALRRLSDEKKTDYILCTSDFLKPIFSSAFQTEKVLINGYPRNDILENNNIENVCMKEEEKVIRYLQEKKKTQVIAIYMPTFRESEKEFFNVISLNQLTAFLERENILLCIKLHPKSKLNEQFKRIADKNIFVIDSSADPYPLLHFSDVLITDYSSIYFDYLLLNKPIIFFAYDLEEYLSDSREMYFDYEEFTPGVKVYNQSQLEEALANPSYGKDQCSKIKCKVFNEPDLCASEELYRKIVKITEYTE